MSRIRIKPSSLRRLRLRPGDFLVVNDPRITGDDMRRISNLLSKQVDFPVTVIGMDLVEIPIEFAERVRDQLTKRIEEYKRTRGEH